MEAEQTKITYVNFDELTNALENIDSDNIVIITEPNIWSHYGSYFKDFKPEGKVVNLYKAPSGESSKTFLEYERCIQFLISKKVHRNAHIIAIGGGALSDLVGFVASSYLRGLSWSVVPTSLLSMIDACLGGKVAINVNETKNMVGAFHHPHNIFINYDFLSSLPSDEVRSALGEVAKYALLEPAIFEKIMLGHPIETIIPDCLEYKRNIIIKDPKERELRRLLNLGHTFGHAIENYYGLAHGTSVFWGMIIETIIFEDHSALEKLSNISTKLGITNGEPPWLNRTFPSDDLMLFVKNDKKVVSNNEINLPIFKDGKVELVQVSLDALEEKLSYKIEFIRTFKL